MSIIFATLITWFVMLSLAIINGVMREKYLNEYLGQMIGHIISTLSLCTLLLITSYFFVRYFGQSYSSKTMLAIGISWLLLTLCFEFIFGHFIVGHSWQHLLADYNILKGRIWILVLLTTTFAPLLCQSIMYKNL